MDRRSAVVIAQQSEDAAMNYTLMTADQDTHIRVVTVALGVSIVVVWIVMALS